MVALLLSLLFNTAQAQQVVAYVHDNGRLIPIYAAANQNPCPTNRAATLDMFPVVAPRARDWQQVHVGRAGVARRTAPAQQPAVAFGFATPNDWTFLFQATTAPPPPRVKRTTTVTTTSTTVTRRR